MKRSANRILTTHVGSLIRPPRLLELVRARETGEPGAVRAYEECLKDSVAEVVKRQAQAGIDIVNDGEFGKSTSWCALRIEARERLRDAADQSGSEPVRPRRRPRALQGVLRGTGRRKAIAPGRT